MAVISCFIVVSARYFWCCCKTDMRFQWPEERRGGCGTDAGERLRHGNGAGQVVCSQWGVRLVRGDWAFPVAAKQGTGLCPDSFCAADKARGPFVPTAVLDGGVPRGGKRGNALRSVGLYFLRSTRVLCGKYSSALRKVQRRAAGGMAPCSRRRTCGMSGKKARIHGHRAGRS